MGKTDLEKSHSKWSNTKLTILCVVATIAVSMLWAILGLKNHLDNTIFYVGLAISGAVSLLSLVLFNIFKR